MTDTDQSPAPNRKVDALAFLGTTFPVFRNCRPLAIGIHKAIRVRHPEIDRESLRRALKFHTASTRYLKALTQEDVRVDLDGVPAGEVTAEQKQAARDALRERYKKVAGRKAAEQDALKLQENLRKLAEKFNSR